MTVSYLYKDESVDFVFKAISADPNLKEDFVFFAIDEPSDRLVGEATLPAITGMLGVDEENPYPRVFNFQGMT